MMKNNKEEKQIVGVIVRSAKEQRINFSQDKCKYIIIGNKKDDFEETFFGEEKLKKIKSGKVLGYYFNEKGNNDA